MSVNTVTTPAADIVELRKSYDEIIRNWEKVLAEHQRAAAEHQKLLEVYRQAGIDTSQQEQQHQQSYVKLAIAVLEELGKPTPIKVLLEHIRDRRNNHTITRGAVETSLLRYLNTKGDSANITKPCPGTYLYVERPNDVTLAIA